MLEEIKAKIPIEDIKEIVHPITQDVAVNGFAGVSAIQSLPRSTSAGFPYNKSKRHFLQPGEPKEYAPHPVEVTPVIQKDINQIITAYSQNELANPVFTAALKDEPVSVKKQLSGKTRVFCGAPFGWSIVVRMYYLSLIRLVFNFREVFECGVGLTAQSIEWEHLYHYIISMGENNMIAGDFRSFDKSMPSNAILAGFWILIQLAIYSGNYEDVDILVMHGISYDTAFPTVNFFGVLITFFGNNPSGHPLTVIINSLVNSLYMRLAFRSLGRPVSTFKLYVALMTYGDDNIMSSKLEEFNHTTIQKALAAFGIEYTMADKEQASVPFIHVRETSFLKRTFVYDEDIGHWVAPLDFNSIVKMLCVGVRSRTVTPEEQYADTLRSAQQEVFFHGKTVFNQFTTLFKECIEEIGISLFFKDQPLLEWDDLVKRYEKVSAGVENFHVNHAGTLACGSEESKPKLN
jgi:hypothetical protein